MLPQITHACFAGKCVLRERRRHVGVRSQNPSPAIGRRASSNGNAFQRTECAWRPFARAAPAHGSWVCVDSTRTATAAAVPDSAARTVAYHRRLKRTSSMGEKNTNQKKGVLASAVMAAIFDSGTCAAAMSWGMTKKTSPLVNPRVALERPISHKGETRRVQFKQTSSECHYTTPRLPEPLGMCAGFASSVRSWPRALGMVDYGKLRSKASVGSF